MKSLSCCQYYEQFIPSLLRLTLGALICTAPLARADARWCTAALLTPAPKEMRVDYAEALAFQSVVLLALNTLPTSAVDDFATHSNPLRGSLEQFAQLGPIFDEQRLATNQYLKPENFWQITPEYGSWHNRNILAAAEKLAPTIHMELELEEKAAKADLERNVAADEFDKLRYSLGQNQPFAPEVVQAAKTYGEAQWDASVLEMLSAFNRMGAATFIHGHMEINADRISSYNLPWM
jgi:hypothetical protein